MNVAVQLEPSSGSLAAVEYRWDTDTDILTARLTAPADGTGASGSLELEGPDGTWLILDVERGRLMGVEVAVWPEVRKRAQLAPPVVAEDVRVIVPLRASEPGAALLEVDTPIHAESDEAERVIHFQIGAKREVRSVRLGRELLLDLDMKGRIAGLWLLDVPPFPST